MSRSRPARAFPVTGALVLFGVCAVLVLVLLVDAVVRSGLPNALLLAPWPLLVLWAVYVVGIASDVRADGDGVRVQNLLRWTWLPWGRVSRMVMRWQIEFALDDGQVVRCFGGPARSRPRRLGPGRTKEEGDADTDDALAHLRRLRAEAAASDGAVQRGWDVPTLAALAILVVWAAVAVAVSV